MSRSPRRNLRPNGIAEFLSRLLASFIGTLFGGLIAGVLLLLIVRSYLHWSVKSTAEEFNKALDEERRKTPPPVFTMPTFSDPWATPPSGKKK